MQLWTPDQLFLYTYIISAVCGIAELFRSTRPITCRSITAAILVNGAAGCGIGMMVYEYFDGSGHPWRVLVAGMMIGLRAVKFEDITTIVGRILGIDMPSKKDKDNGES